MHDGVDVTALGEQVRDRRTEMPGLRGKAVLFIDVEMRLRHAGLDAIGSMIDEHIVLHGGASRREGEFFRPAATQVNSPSEDVLHRRCSSGCA